MWHEARKQEKKIREVMVDFQRRAERRREHYDKLKADPTSYLRIIGTKCRLHLDPTGGERDSSTMIPWQGDDDNLISRYDVRIHMDVIPDYSKLPVSELTAEEKQEETKINYERYRSVIINEFNNVPESDVLAKIDVDELYSDVRRAQKATKRQSKNKSAISYDYDHQQGTAGGTKREREDELSDESDNDMDFDIDVFSSRQIDKLNVLALDYRVSQGYFSRSLRSEKTFLMEQKQAKMAEMERSSLSGKKARKERRLFKEMSLRSRLPSPPLFAPKDTSMGTGRRNRGDQDSGSSSSSSRSVSPDGKMEFITEFGGDVPTPSSSSTGGHMTKPRHPSSSSGRRKRRSSSSSESGSSSPPPARKRRHHSRDGHYYHRSHHHSDTSGDRDKERRSYTSGSHESRSRRSRSRSVERVSALTKSKLEAKKSQPKKPLPSLQQKQQDKTKLTPQERLKRKMQSQLSKTFKEDKKVEKHKAEAKEVERIEREEKMKEETLKLRRRTGHDDSYGRSSHYSRSPSPDGQYHRH